jgi:hypothetical protein
LPIRPQDNAVRTVRGPIRVPTVIVAVNYAKVPKKRPKLLNVPRAPKELPASETIRNAHDIPEWKLFMRE